MLRALACVYLFVLLSGGAAAAGPVTLLSVADPERPSETAGGTKEVVGLSSDGRYVLLLSNTDNLLAGVDDTNAGKDLFLHDRVAGTTVLVSHAAGDPSATGNAEVRDAALSADGRWVVFRSAASDLVIGQVDQAPGTGASSDPDIFLWDRDNDLTRLVSHLPGLSTTAAGWCWVLEDPKISSDGGRIAFVSLGNLVTGLSGDVASPNVYLYDRAADANTLVSHAGGAATVARGGAQTALSADGGWVAFVSFGADLAAGQVDTNGGADVFLYEAAAGTNVLVSHAAGSAVTAANAGYDFFELSPQVSANGGWVAYASLATNLVAGQTDTNLSDDLFLYERASGANTLVSRASGSATAAGNGGSQDSVLSADGRYVAFTSGASDLVPDDTNGWGDVFVFDRLEGANLLVSRQGLTSANSFSFLPRISADGSWIGFSSPATNLVAGQTDTSGTTDVFLWSRAAGTISLLSRTTGSATTSAGGDSGGLRLSADASWIALFSTSEKLVDGVDDFNGLADVFLYERAAGEHHLITLRDGAASATAGGRIADRARTVMSNDGRFIAFTSAAPNLVSGGEDQNNQTDVFLRDRLSGKTWLVSHASGAPSAAGNAGSHGPLVSADGSTVVFESAASDLVPGQMPGQTPGQTAAFALGQLYFSERSTGAITLVSHAPSSPSTPAFGGAEDGGYAVSGDGRWIAYAFSGNLIDGQADANGGADIFLFDRATGTNMLVSRSGSSATQAANGPSRAPSISGDGRYVAFASTASDLVPGQGGAGGVFLFDRAAGTITRVSSSASQSLAISTDGRWVVFVSPASNVVPGQADTNSTFDVFLWDRVSGSALLVSHAASSPTATGNARSDLGTSAEHAAALSADGRWVVFSSNATDLIAGQTGSSSGLYLFDRITGAVTLVSRSAASATERRTALEPAISADGRFVAFASTEGDLVPGQIDHSGFDFFLHNRIAGTTELVSHVPSSAVTGGTFGANSSVAPRISADAAWVAFHSPAVGLAADDHDGTTDAFLFANLLPGRDLFTLSPCRILDTRQAGQGPILASGVKRSWVVHGTCGIPETARALVVNVTVVQPSAPGYLVLHAGDIAPETTATITFNAGQTRSNNAIVPLAFDGSGALAARPLVQGNGTVHLIVDVSGYLE